MCMRVLKKKYVRKKILLREKERKRSEKMCAKERAIHILPHPSNSRFSTHLYVLRRCTKHVQLKSEN